MKNIVSLLILSLVTNFAIAQNTILWSVTKPNSDKTSYILGTYHQMGNSFVDEKPLIKELLAKSDLVIFESVENIQENIVDVLMNRTDDFSYKEILQKDDVDFLENYSKDWKIPIHKLKPGELIIKLQQEIGKNECGTIRPTDTSNQMDDYLQSLAEKQNIPIAGLETYADQMKAINTNAADKEEFTWVKAKDIIHHLVLDAQTKNKKRLKQICAIATSYMKMKLDYQLNARCAENDEIFAKRNQKWMPQIKKSIEENKTVFIAVGLYHLYFECGIVSQLRKEGYKVEPIKLK